MELRPEEMGAHALGCLLRLFDRLRPGQAGLRFVRAAARGAAGFGQGSGEDGEVGESAEVHEVEACPPRLPRALAFRYGLVGLCGFLWQNLVWNARICVESLHFFCRWIRRRAAVVDGTCVSTERSRCSGRVDY